MITRVRLTLDPGTTGNLIHKIQNIDVNSVGNPAAVPEPASLTLLGLGLLGGKYLRRRRA